MQKPNPLKAMSLTLVTAGLMLIPVSSSFAASHQAPPKATAAGESEAHECFISQLGLSQEQSQKVKAIMAGGHKQGQALKTQLRTKKHDLMQYLQSPDASQSQALSRNNDINNLQRQLGELRLKTFFAMRAQLTPEQLQKLQHLQKEHMGKRDGQSCGPRGESSHGQQKPDKHHL